jgi:hypothetical protein
MEKNPIELSILLLCPRNILGCMISTHKKSKLIQNLNLDQNKKKEEVSNPRNQVTDPNSQELNHTNDYWGDDYDKKFY